MVYLKNVKLQNFRSHKDRLIEFTKGANIIIGPNGVGKTNVIESIFYLFLGSSYKTSNNKSLPTFGESDFSIEGTLIDNRRKITENCSLNNRANSNSGARIIIFSPESTNIISSNPITRRNALDNIIAQYDPKFKGVMSNYNHIIKQRSNLISNANNSDINNQLDFWDEKYANHSAYITNSRSRLITQINMHIGSIYDDIIKHLNTRSNRVLSDLEIVFTTTPSEISSEEIVKSLKDNRGKEKILGWTNIGAKGDDFTLNLAGNIVKGNSSYGEQWSIMIAFTLAIWKILKDADSSFTKYEPILLLDDVFTGLDNDRRNELVRQIKKIGQCIITCADDKDIPDFKYHRIDFQY